MALCRLAMWPGIFILLLLPSLVLVSVVVSPVHQHAGRHPALPSCASRNTLPAITEIYVIHSYWSPERRDYAPSLCRWLKESGGEMLSGVPCTLFPGVWATAASPEQIQDLVARRIVAPETHAKPHGLFTRLLYYLGISNAAPLFDENERVTNPSYLGTAASHLLAVQNWTLELSRRGIPPAARSDRHLLLFEDDAAMTNESVAALQRAVTHLDRCYDVLGLDSTDNFCASNRLWDRLFRWLPLCRRSQRLVSARVTYSRNTGLVVSYKGAINLLGGLPVTREIDLWFRDLVTDGLLRVYVACPRIVGNSGLETVTRR